jgi:hypothetical protein
MKSPFIAMGWLELVLANLGAQSIYGRTQPMGLSKKVRQSGSDIRWPNAKSANPCYVLGYYSLVQTIYIHISMVYEEIRVPRCSVE